jgi:dipeptidyl aminopeptidase/acylaminoacyl peptidase
MRLLTVADVFDTQIVSDAQVSPDGQLIAFVVGDAWKDGTPSAKSQIWIVNSDGTGARPFTTGPRTDHSPRWSPDSQWLAFLSDRMSEGDKEDCEELFLISRHGGEARRLFEAKSSVGGDTSAIPYIWSADGKQIAFLMTDPETDEEKKLKKEKIDPILFERDHKFDRVWVADVATGATRCITTENIQVWEFGWASEAGLFTLIVSEEPYEWSWYHARLAVTAEGQPIRTLYDPAPRQIAGPIPSPDGSQIVFTQSIWSDRGSVGGDLYIIDSNGGAPRNLSEGYDASISWAAWMPNGRSLIVLANVHDGSRVEQWQTVDGHHRLLWTDEVAIANPFWAKFSGDTALRTLAFARESKDEPRQIWIARRDHDSLEWTRLTSFHKHFDEIAQVQSKRVQWRGADGWEIDGYLLLPPNYESGSCPLFTWVHGGPTSLFMSRYWNSMMYGYFAAKGFAVFLPNPRGSTGRGLKFAEANVGDMGGQDFADIMAGIEHLLKSGVGDPEKLAIGGWSYGGFMTAWAVTQTQRFKAAVMGAGISNWLSFHGISKLCEWDRIHYNTDPYELHTTFEQFSPLTYITNVTTPTLLVHGEKDWDVPPSQGYEFFRALKQHGVPTELRVYPHEPHGFREKAHQRDWVDYAAQWLERWLK